ncbi:MAG: malate synthase A [Deltaproteobacteria bacterium]|jgi:malate synthase|nr:malate synthase A [Deltaproteobacteria bacterium]MBW2531389.1 malate synthase A [Deltaproteobacteria bacterium]
MQSQLNAGTDESAATAPTKGLIVVGRVTPEYEEILTPDALAFVEKLARAFQPTRDKLLARRVERQKRFDAGELPDFLPETKSVRESEWTVAPIPEDLQDRRVEITGPVDRKMIINALNSGANVFMADFEDSNSPTWDNVVRGQLNLRDAARRTITFTNPAGKHYELKEKIATLMVRPRGWHLSEKNALLDGEPVSASLFDFGLFFFHNAKESLKRGTGPYFYLPKLESHLEARLWNDVFVLAQQEVGLPNGTIRATVLIETIPAAFEMDEILYELKDHSAGLNCGRWDYIFSIIKRFRNNEKFLMPDRGEVTMTRHNMRSYSRLAVKTCHRRGIHAMGGMAAQIPIKNDPEANEAAIGKVKADKVREAGDGHDGTWVAHPGLVQLALDCFNAEMPQPNQIDKKLEDVTITREDLLDVPQGAITEKGVRHNVDVGIQYMAAWLSGNGCVPIYNLMEDAATAEISRSQLWQWVHHPEAKLDDGREVTGELVGGIFDEVLASLKAELGEERFRQGRYELAAKLMKDIVLEEEFTEFLTLVGYEEIN